MVATWCKLSRAYAAIHTSIFHLNESHVTSCLMHREGKPLPLPASRLRHDDDDDVICIDPGAARPPAASHRTLPSSRQRAASIANGRPHGGAPYVHTGDNSLEILYYKI